MNTHPECYAQVPFFYEYPLCIGDREDEDKCKDCSLYVDYEKNHNPYEGRD